MRPPTRASVKERPEKEPVDRNLTQIAPIARQPSPLPPLGTGRRLSGNGIQKGFLRVLLPGARVQGLLLAVLLLTPITSVRAQGTLLTLNETQVWEFAETLFSQGEYYRAISEYQRLLYFFPGSRYRGGAALRIAEADLNGGDPQGAERHLTALLNDPAWKPIAAELRFLRAVAHLEQNAQRPYPLWEPQVHAALEDLRALPPEWPGTARARGFQSAVEQGLPEDGKSPWLAAGLSSLVPGLGSVYVERYREGLLALFVNGVFGYAAVNAWRAGREGLGTVLGTAALAFYGGAVYAAANGAHQYNDRGRSRFLEEARARWGLVPRAEGIFAALETHF